MTAFNLSERCPDKTIQGRVLAAWGLLYASQDRDIHYLSSAKQKLGKAVTLAPSDADVLASSGYFLSRLDSFRPRTQAETATRSAAKETAKAKSGAKSSGSHRHGKADQVDEARTIITFRSDNERGKLLVDEIINQAIMNDPGNWLALWTKYERVTSQGKSEDMKTLAAQLKHYFPTINLSPYLH